MGKKTVKPASPPLLFSLHQLLLPVSPSMTFTGILVGACQGPGDPSWPGALMKAVARFLTKILKEIKLSKIILQSRECGSAKVHISISSLATEQAWSQLGSHGTPP